MAKKKVVTTAVQATLHEAYAIAVNDDASAAKMGLSRVRKYQVQQDILGGRYPKEATMRAHLTKCGWSRLQDELWMRP